MALPLLVVIGSTGTGKSELAVDLAEHLGGEIVGCDALQVYRGLDCATAKPPQSLRQRVPHHLVDCVDPGRDFSMFDYVQRAQVAIAGIRDRGRLPIVVGGSGMYLRGLLRGVIEAPPRDVVLQRRLNRIAQRRGTRGLHRWLAHNDPRSAARIQPADTQRVVRAVELACNAGGSWSELLGRSGTWDESQERMANVKIGLAAAMEWLQPRLEARVERFFEAGLVAEVRELLGSGVPAQANCFKAIGYREVVDALTHDQDPRAVLEHVKRSTRRYAKRQRTWFRREADVTWLDAAEMPARRLKQALAVWSERADPHC